ncbi:MAG: hypothetical protein AAFQ44_01475 [Pseudomonadota bacterium]
MSFSRDDWFLTRGTQEWGPLTPADLADLASRDLLLFDDCIRLDGSDFEVRVAEVDGLLASPVLTETVMTETDVTETDVTVVKANLSGAVPEFDGRLLDYAADLIARRQRPVRVAEALEQATQTEPGLDVARMPSADTAVYVPTPLATGLVFDVFDLPAGQEAPPQTPSETATRMEEASGKPAWLLESLRLTSERKSNHRGPSRQVQTLERTSSDDTPSQLQATDPSRVLATNGMNAASPPQVEMPKDWKSLLDWDGWLMWIECACRVRNVHCVGDFFDEQRTGEVAACLYGELPITVRLAVSMTIGPQRFQNSFCATARKLRETLPPGELDRDIGEVLHGTMSGDVLKAWVQPMIEQTRGRVLGGFALAGTTFGTTTGSAAGTAAARPPTPPPALDASPPPSR